MKTKRRPDASAPRPRRVQPRPGGAAPAPGRARSSPPSMKLWKPHSGTDVPPGQWDRGSAASAWGARPWAAGEAGSELGVRRESPHPPRGRAARDPPPLPSAFTRQLSGTAPYTAARSRRPAPLLGPVILWKQKARFLASCPQGVPMSLPNPGNLLKLCP